MTEGQSMVEVGFKPKRAAWSGASQLELLSRFERRKAATRERIYRAALALISKHGLAGTRVEEITEAAEVAKGTFFNYFPSKEHVFTALVEIQLDKVRAAVAEAKRGGRSIRNILRRLFLALAEEPGRSASLAAGLVSAILGNKAVRKFTAVGMVEGRTLLTRILALGLARGELRADHDPLAMALALQEALFGALVVWAINPERRLQARLHASFEDYWRGIAAPKEVAK